MPLAKLLLAAALAVTLAACGTSRLASVLGACEDRPVADVVMFGADPRSQAFLDDTIEDNVARCAHARPAPRPDPRVVPKPKAQPPKAKPKAKPSMAQKAKSLLFKSAPKPATVWPPPPPPLPEPET